MTARDSDDMVFDRRRELSRSHRPPLTERLGGTYLIVLGVAVYGSMVLSGLSRLNITQACAAEEPCIRPEDTSLFAWGLAVLVAGALAVTASALGPTSASSGEVSWLLSTPIDRARMLRVRFTWAVAVAAVSGGVAGGFVWASATGMAPLGSDVAAAVVAGSLVGVAIVGAACNAQSHRRWDVWWRRVPPVMVSIGTVACLSSIVHLGHLSGLGLVVQLHGWVLVPLTLLSMALLTSAARSLRSIPVASLRESGLLYEALASSTTSLDLGHASRRLAAQRMAGRSSQHSRRGIARGTTALWVRDVMTLRHRRRLWSIVVVAMLVPSFFLILIGPDVALIAMIVVSTCVARSAAQGLKTASRSPGVVRSLPFTTRQMRASLTVTPLVVSLLLMIAVALLTSIGPFVAVSIALDGVAGALRASEGQPVGTTGLLVMTSSGVLPLGMVANLVRGFDVAFLGAAPLLLGIITPLAVILPLAYIAITLNRPDRGWLGATA